MEKKLKKMKLRKILLIIGTVTIAYLTGAALGIPFTQGGLTFGNIGYAFKQHEQLNSPSDVRMAEKFENDTVYRNKLTNDFAILYVQAMMTLATVDSFKKKASSVDELKPYLPKMGEMLETGKNLTTRLNETLAGLKSLKETKTIEGLSLTMSQAINLFQVMNNQLSELDNMAAKAGELAKQKKINNDLIKTCSEYFIGVANIASICKEHERAKMYVRYMQMTGITAERDLKAVLGREYQPVMNEVMGIGVSTNMLGDDPCKIGNFIENSADVEKIIDHTIDLGKCGQSADVTNITNHKGIDAN